ncbi:MAG: tetratricopeptide repeat protein [Prevotellaceae bacterium]|jgi:hypothetical protein|nr:tetratricopeptide repeat protein [Prevotellaceae bacterium]
MESKTARDFYTEGQRFRKKGELGNARNCFKKALELQPDYAEAKVALEMVDSILSFGYTDMYNV